MSLSNREEVRILILTISGIRKPADLPVTNILRAVLAITAFAFSPPL